MAAPPERKICILVADDNRAHCYALAKRLIHCGYQVRQVYDGYSALRGSRGFPDLIMMDVNMPGIDGLEVCRRVKQDPSSAHIPVILFSATVDVEECRVLARNAGGIDLIPAAQAIELVPLIHSLITKWN
jgi:CheY-like chemotaxis protein